jgi:hypothetical protein
MEPECQHLDDGELLGTRVIAFCRKEVLLVRRSKKPAKVKGTSNTRAIYGNEADVENELPK